MPSNYYLNALITWPLNSWDSQKGLLEGGRIYMYMILVFFLCGPIGKFVWREKIGKGMVSAVSSSSVELK